MRSFTFSAFVLLAFGIFCSAAPAPIVAQNGGIYIRDLAGDAVSDTETGVNQGASDTETGVNNGASNTENGVNNAVSNISEDRFFIKPSGAPY
jgi:hypothetical protein